MNIQPVIIALIMAGATVCGAAGALIVAYWNKPKIQAERRKLNKEADSIEQATVEKYQRRIEDVFERLDKEYEEKEKRNKEFEIEIADIRTSKDMTIAALTTKVNEQAAQIAQLEKDKEKLEALVHKHGGEIDKLTKKVTGQLPPHV